MTLLLDQKNLTSFPSGAQGQLTEGDGGEDKNRWVHLITLGCARNRVDSEVMLGTLLGDGWSYCEDPAEAEMIVINTCGFIQAAKEESIDTILEMAEYKKHSSVILVVAGCLSQRYKSQLVKSLPEVDLFVGSDQFARLPDILEAHEQQKRDQLHSRAPAAQKLYTQRSGALYSDFMPRVNTLHSHCAYVKIAEGCDHQCAFCIIPAIRGRLRSRSIESVVQECKNLAEGGVREVNLIAQDLAAYGRDRGSEDLLPLLQKMAEVEGLSWIRLLYMYPENISADFLDFLADEPKMVPYLDIPMQHGHSAVLERMNRGVSAQQLRDTVAWVRDKVEGIAIRTSVMVGFPAETEEEFQELYRFVEDMRFDHLGCFVYSQEAGTRAGAMEQQIEHSIKERRRTEIMQLQRQISASKLQNLRGRKVMALMERPFEMRASSDQESAVPVTFGKSYGRVAVQAEKTERRIAWQARLSTQAPEVDGRAYLTVDQGNEAEASLIASLKVGDIIPAFVERTSDYDVMVRSV